MHSKGQLFIIFFIVIVALCLVQVKTDYKTCHYSCTYCGSNDYSHCVFCNDGFTLTAMKNKDHTNLHYNHIQQYPWGTCIGTLSPINVFGMIMFIISVIAFIWLKNRTIFYFLNAMQTFALLSLIQVGFLDHISFLLQSFQIFMFTSSLNKTNQQYDMNLYESKRLRMMQFARSYAFKDNFMPVFLISLACFIVAFIIPVCRYFSKKQGSLWTICSGIPLQKVFNSIQIGSILCFIFLMQQCVLMMSIGLFLDQKFSQSGNIVLIVIYGLILALMIVNLCSKNFDFFPNKICEQIQILKKCILPPFIVLPVGGNVAVAGFMFLLAFLGLVFNSTKNKQKVKTDFHQNLIKRQFRYKLVELALILMVILYFIIQKFLNSYPASNAIGIITVLVIIAFIICFFVQVTFQLYGRYFLKQNQKLYKQNDFNFSSVRPTKNNLQQTLQNFQNTQEGLMQMVFFSRNISPQKQNVTKRNNIKLTLDVMDGSQNITQQKGDISNHTSPTNKDNQRFKSRSARTPKNNKFRLNKIFQPNGDNNQEQKFQERSVSAKPQHEQNTHIEKSQRSQDIAPKTSRRQDVIRTARQIKIEVLQQQPTKSPRFGTRNQKQSPRFKENQQQDNMQTTSNQNLPQQIKVLQSHRAKLQHNQNNRIKDQQENHDRQHNIQSEENNNNVQNIEQKQHNQEGQKVSELKKNAKKKKNKSKIAKIYGGN